MGKLAIGMIEVEGHTVALAVIDQMTKEVDVTILAVDCNNPRNEATAEIPMTVQVIFEGEISDVRHALTVGEKTALNYVSKAVISTSYVSKEAEGLRPLLITGKVIPQRYVSKREVLDSSFQESSLAIFEVQHFVNALSLSNDLLKSFNLSYAHHELNLGGRLISLIFTGDESQVMAAIDYAETHQGNYDHKILTKIQLNNPTTETLRYAIRSGGER
ncbi:BMC domain-containing protein [Vagococcus sp. BWB3-3]|uniref:BMC domain-containing protein n=1 Tax=Vagococcus allomyrinae TaxID=2794353 RepID=A0A940STY3_9ENTE|nr:BMC domain-containing protein [Vagococcus allomyrinae]MBP1039536.1 BMC domain-containing protein [Vagococcus allomyrinae]